MKYKVVLQTWCSESFHSHTSERNCKISAGSMATSRPIRQPRCPTGQLEDHGYQHHARQESYLKVPKGTSVVLRSVALVMVEVGVGVCGLFWATPAKEEPHQSQPRNIRAVYHG
jgi:hypothetical protein